MVPRPISQKERGEWKVDGGILTQESDAHRRNYNCHGFSTGVGKILILKKDGPTFLVSMGYEKTACDVILDTHEVVALFEKPCDAACWHTAKRLSGEALPLDLYESKFAFMVDSEPLPVGLRIAHRLHAIQQCYGKVHSLWVRDASPVGDKKRFATLEAQEVVDVFPGPDGDVEDSAKCLNDRPDLLLVLPPPREQAGRCGGSSCPTCQKATDPGADA